MQTEHIYETDINIGGKVIMTTETNNETPKMKTIITKEHIKKIQHIINQSLYEKGNITYDMYSYVKAKIEKS